MIPRFGKRKLLLESQLTSRTMDPTQDLRHFAGKQMVIVGGFGPGGGAQQWRSLWGAFMRYGDGSPAKEEIERTCGCNYYCGDAHALTLANDEGSPQWQKMKFDPDAAAVLQRTGHTLTALHRRGWLLLLGGRNLQREGDAACMLGTCLLQLCDGAPRLCELVAMGEAWDVGVDCEHCGAAPPLLDVTVA